MKYAVIDIGSNSVRLLLWADGHTIYKKVCTTRLGEGVSLTGELSRDAMERTAKAVSEFAEQAEREGADKLFAFATAAVRSGRNGRDFVRLVQTKCGVTVDVVGGEKEAELGFKGALEGRDGGIIDVGGASTEVTVGKDGQIIYAVSADIGAVRLKDLCGENRARLEKVIADKTGVFDAAPHTAMTAIGGTATSLAALEYEVEPYDPAVIHGCKLSAERALFWADTLLSMPQADRLNLKGMDKKRADILGGAALLLGSVMKKLGAESVRISETDNLEGYLFEQLRRQE